jgi:hypothetical protein
MQAPLPSARTEGDSEADADGESYTDIVESESNRHADCNPDCQAAGQRTLIQNPDSSPCPIIRETQIGTIRASSWAGGSSRAGKEDRQAWQQ